MKRAANQTAITSMPAINPGRAIRTDKGVEGDCTLVRGIRTLHFIHRLLPEGLGEIHDDAAGVRVLVATRTAVDALPRHWHDTAGVYVLLGPVHDDGTYTVSVCDARAGIIDLDPKDQHWSHQYVLLVRSIDPALDDTETIQLKLALLHIFRAAHCPIPDNPDPDPDHLTMPAGDFRALWEIPESLQYAMAALGFDTSPYKTRAVQGPESTPGGRLEGLR